jgi:hypothetical protein
MPDHECNIDKTLVATADNKYVKNMQIQEKLICVFSNYDMKVVDANIDCTSEFTNLTSS